MNLSLAQRLAVAVAAVATPIVIIGVSVLVFLNPIWVGFEQSRTGVDQLTGYSPAEVSRVTGSILSNLVFGPPSFDVAVNGAPVLDARERSHMVDVRRVFFELGGVAALALVALLAVGIGTRGRRPFWTGVQAGATFLAGAVVAVGILFTLFFDQAFLIFHEIFFPPGSFEFNPATQKLVQLFPDQFWSDTSTALALVMLALAIGVAIVASRQLRRDGRLAGSGVRGLA